MGWKLLTEVYGLSKDRLYVTYFGGDEKQGLAPDLEAKELWLKVGVPENRILPGSAKDNFWGMFVFYDSPFEPFGSFATKKKCKQEKCADKLLCGRFITFFYG
jgi:hypothetical protein